MVLRELVRMAPSIRAAPLGAEGAGLRARQRGLQLLRRGWSSDPELKGGSEASEGDQANNVSNEALYVIGLHGSGDKISRAP